MKLLAICRYHKFNTLFRYFVIADDGNLNKLLFSVCTYGDELDLTQILDYKAEELVITLLYIDMMNLIKPNNSIIVLPDMFLKNYQKKKINLDISIPNYLSCYRSI